MHAIQECKQLNIMYHLFMCLCFRIVAKKEGKYYEKIEELKEVMLKLKDIFKVSF